MILAIETSSPQASLSLCHGGTIIWNKQFITDRSHNSKIFEPLVEALDLCQRKLDLIAVGTGPGSYSGVRVGIATANGLSLALEVPVVGLSSLEAYDGAASSYLVLGDARRSTFFAATIINGNLEGEPQLLEDTALVSLISQTSPRSIYTMDQSVAKKSPLIKVCYPTASQVAIQAEQRHGGDLSQRLHSAPPIEPYYLRLPYITQAKKRPIPGFE